MLKVPGGLRASGPGRFLTLEGCLPPDALDVPSVSSPVPNQVIRADDLARVMVDAAVRGTPLRAGPVLENRDIRTMVASLQ
jgi:hypothetical protein